MAGIDSDVKAQKCLQKINWEIRRNMILHVWMCDMFVLEDLNVGVYVLNAVSGLYLVVVCEGGWGGQGM